VSVTIGGLAAARQQSKLFMRIDFIIYAYLFIQIYAIFFDSFIFVFVKNFHGKTGKAYLFDK
jgi:hypothetical protein